MLLVKSYTFKYHYVGTKEIANEVLRDLEQRDPSEICIEESSENGAFWDPGGMLMTEDENFKFPLDTIVVKCKAQHFELFKDYIEKTKFEIRGVDYKYIKLHGHWTCICLNPNELDKLKEMVNNEDYCTKAAIASTEREQKIYELNKSGAIVSIRKDANGNLIAPYSKNSNLN